MELYITGTGTVRCVYDELLDLSQLGALCITRASHVEPDTAGRWWADLSPASGPTLGPFAQRSGALEAEAKWLSLHRLEGAAD